MRCFSFTLKKGIRLQCKVNQFIELQYNYTFFFFRNKYFYGNILL